MIFSRCEFPYAIILDTLIDYYFLIAHFCDSYLANACHNLLDCVSKAILVSRGVGLGGALSFRPFRGFIWQDGCCLFDTYLNTQSSNTLQNLVCWDRFVLSNVIVLLLFYGIVFSYLVRL